MTSVYRTTQGKQIDMHKLAMQNELTIAVGNMKVNARGDKIGPGGYVIKKNENTHNSIVTSDQVRKEPETPVVETPVVETPVVETPVVETPVAENTAGKK